MAVAEILRLLELGTQMVGSLTTLVAGTRDTLSSDDKAQVDAALADLQARSEQHYATARAALIAAAAAQG